MHGTCGINMAMFSHNKDAIKEVIAKIILLCYDLGC